MMTEEVGSGSHFWVQLLNVIAANWVLTELLLKNPNRVGFVGGGSYSAPQRRVAAGGVVLLCFNVVVSIGSSFRATARSVLVSISALSLLMCCVVAVMRRRTATTKAKHQIRAICTASVVLGVGHWVAEVHAGTIWSEALRVAVVCHAP